jgi:hypothetical protein
MEQRELIEHVRELIDKYDLKNPCRLQKYTYPRYYLFAVLKQDARMPWVEIARMFEKNHSTVIHGLQIHDMLTKTKDLGYRYFTASIRDEIKLQEKDEERDIAKDVLSCRTYNQIKQLQQKIKDGYYD